ncbi:MAG: group I intron-associated PD-(D/E)XK endonuclease [Gaiellaceae bacterium]
MEHPKLIGDRTTLAVMLGLRQAGYALLVPFGENTRYDLVVDDGNQLARFQCKTGRLREGAIRFAACSTYAHHPNPTALRRDYKGEVDFFGVYCPETGGVYLVPIGDANVRRQGNLRVTPSRNGQAKGVRFAARYEIANFGPFPSTEEPRVSSGAPGSCA